MTDTWHAVEHSMTDNPYGLDLECLSAHINDLLPVIECSTACQVSVILQSNNGMLSFDMRNNIISTAIYGRRQCISVQETAVAIVASAATSKLGRFSHLISNVSECGSYYHLQFTQN